MVWVWVSGSLGTLQALVCGQRTWGSPGFGDMLVAHAEGVEVYPGTLISKAACEEGKVTITTEDGKEVGEGRGVCGCVLGEGEGCVCGCVLGKGGQ